MKSLITLFLILFLSSCNSQNPFYLASSDSQCSHINNLFNKHLNCVKRKWYDVPCSFFRSSGSDQADFERGLIAGNEISQQCKRELSFPQIDQLQTVKCLGGVKGMIDKGANMLDDRLRSCH